MDLRNLKIILVIVSMTCPIVCSADLGVSTKTWPKQLPNSEYGPHNYYGNSRTPEFREATIGDGAREIPASEQDYVDTLMKRYDTKNWYLKVGMYKATSRITGVQNISPEAPNANYIVIQDAEKAYSDLTKNSFGIGYIFEQTRLELEYLAGNTTIYNQLGLLTIGAPDLTSTLTSQHILGNLYFELDNFFIFRPFIAGTLGIGMNTIKDNYTRMGALGDNGAGKPKLNFGLAYGLQAGARIQLYKTRFFVSASYRAISFGQAKWRDHSTKFMLKGKRSINGSFLEIMYLW